MHPSSIKSQHEFDIFVKKPKIGWRFDTRIHADSVENAKKNYLDANLHLPANFVTAYPRR